MIAFLKLLRVKHYVKNFLILMPIFFAGKLFDQYNLIIALCGFFSFSFCSSVVYIFNDIADRDKDKLHPIKKNRPIAAGTIKVSYAIILGIILFLIAVLLNIFVLLVSNVNALFVWIILLVYIVSNFMYSVFLKHLPIIDVSILAFGFILRALYGAVIGDVFLSAWMYLTVLSFSFYMGLSKRRNELKKQGSSNTRKVLQYYTVQFLDKNMYMFLALGLIFYSLWAVSSETVARFQNNLMLFTVFWVMLICMKYNLTIEGNTFGDPADVIFQDKILLGMVILYGLILFFIVYGYGNWFAV